MTITIEQLVKFCDEYREGVENHPCYKLVVELSEKHNINFLSFGTAFAECYYVDKNDLIDKMNCVLWIMHYDDPDDYEDIERVLNEELDKVKGV